jgi:hypothetical protein
MELSGEGPRIWIPNLGARVLICCIICSSEFGGMGAYIVTIGAAVPLAMSDLGRHLVNSLK